MNPPMKMDGPERGGMMTSVSEDKAGIDNVMKMHKMMRGRMDMMLMMMGQIMQHDAMQEAVPSR